MASGDEGSPPSMVMKNSEERSGMELQLYRQPQPQWDISLALAGIAAVGNPAFEFTNLLFQDPMAVNEGMTTVSADDATDTLPPDPDKLDIGFELTSLAQDPNLPATFPENPIPDPPALVLPAPALPTPDPLQSATESLVKLGKRPMARNASADVETLRSIIIHALSRSATKCLPIRGIQSAIEQLFPAYHGVPSILKSINELLREYDFPTEPFLIGNRLHFKLLPGINTGSRQFDPSPYHTGPFRLMELPLRIRLMIYKHVLVLPAPNGWIIDDTYTENADKYYRNKLSGESLTLRTYPTKSPFTLVSPPLQTWLALINTAVQKVYSEAVPVFYAHNTFRFESCATLRTFLAKLPTRRHFIGRVILNYDPPLYQSQCTPAFKLLTETNLKYLKLEIHEIDVLNRGNGYGAVGRLPGFFYLEKLRGLDHLAFSGHYDKTKNFLRKMLRPIEGAQKVEDLEEREEKKENKIKAARRVELKKTMKELIKEGKKAATAAKKDAAEREKKRERARKQRAREIEKAKREEEKKAERQEKRKQKEAQREAKQAERELEKEAADAKKEQIRRNKQAMMLAKQGLQKKFNDMQKGAGKHARDVETDSEEEAGPSVKRAKIATLSARSRANAKSTMLRGRGGARGGRGGGVGRANRVVKVKGTTGSKRQVSGPFIEESSSGEEDDQGHPVVESEESEAE